MAVVIRLKRMGTNKKMCHRIVVTDIKNPRDGRFIEEVGSYDARKEPPSISLKKERVEYWLKVGAKPSHTVRQLLKKSGVK
jgi:small subunit ribosomal protein S16